MPELHSRSIVSPTADASSLWTRSACKTTAALKIRSRMAGWSAPKKSRIMQVRVSGHGAGGALMIRITSSTPSRTPVSKILTSVPAAIPGLTTRRLCAAVLAVGVTLALAGSAHAEGAYAFSDNGGGTWAGGAGYNDRTGAAAEAAALASCAKAGGKACKVIATFANACFSISVQEHSSAYAWHIDPDFRVAEQQAQESCQKQGKPCAKRPAFCDGAGRPKPLAAGVSVPRIFSYPLYDNVVGITIFGDIVVNDENLFKAQVLAALRAGKLVSLVRIYSRGGSTDAGIRIGEQIRLLQAETQAPLVEGAVRLCPLDVGVSATGSPIGGKLGTVTFDAGSGKGDGRCRRGRTSAGHWTSWAMSTRIPEP